MKAELLDGLAALVESLRGIAFTTGNADSLKEALALAKSAIPSGQVEKHVAEVASYLNDDNVNGMNALSSLAAQAKSAETYRGMWEKATRELGALSSALETVRRERGDALAERDALKAQLAENGTYERGREVERTNWQNATGASTPRDATGLIAIANAAAANAEKARDSVKAALDMYSNAWKRELSGFLRPKGHEIDMLVVSTKDVVAKAKEADALRKSLADAQSDAAANAEEARMLKERADRLSAAGQVLSEHVDKAAVAAPCGHDLCEGVCTKYGPMDAAPSPPIRLIVRDTTSVRDEFAKAAMQASLGDTWRSASSATMGEFAARAYRMADAMLFARGGAVDLTREQEKETQAPAGHKPTCQNGKHDPVANRPWGCTCRPVRGPAIVPPLGAP